MAWFILFAVIIVLFGFWAFIKIAAVTVLLILLAVSGFFGFILFAVWMTQVPYGKKQTLIKRGPPPRDWPL